MNVLRKEKTQGQKGFTIIEVVLVLAIAGLIFLMVFIALPALQSSQRDTARKNDVSAVASAVTTYSSNNRGAFPPDNLTLTGDANGKPQSTGKFAGYITTVSSNIDTVTIAPTAGTLSASVAQGQMIVTQKTQCGATAAAATVGGVKTAKQILTAGSTRQFTVTTYLEAGGGTSYCQDS